MEIHVTDTPLAAAEDAAGFIARRVWPAVRARGRFTMAVSGGSSPGPLFAALAAMDLPWGSVHLYQVDERVAPSGHPDRNAGMLAEFPVPSTNVHLLDVEWGDKRLVCATYAAALPERLDLVQLGLGDDGHTASWPPGDPVVEVAAPVAAVDSFNGRDRFTLTPVAVNAARCRLMFVTGDGKAKVTAAWLAGDAALPASRVKRSSTHLFCDRAAASAVEG